MSHPRGSAYLGQPLPESVDDYQDYRDYLYSRRHWFFGLLAVMFVVDVIDTAIKQTDYFQHLGPEYLFRNIGYILASLVAMKRPATGTTTAVSPR